MQDLLLTPHTYLQEKWELNKESRVSVSFAREVMYLPSHLLEPVLMGAVIL